MIPNSFIYSLLIFKYFQGHVMHGWHSGIATSPWYDSPGAQSSPHSSFTCISIIIVARACSRYVPEVRVCITLKFLLNLISAGKKVDMIAGMLGRNDSFPCLRQARLVVREQHWAHKSFYFDII